MLATESHMHLHSGDECFAILPDKWFYSWDAQNIRKALGTCLLPKGIHPLPWFLPWSVVLHARNFTTQKTSHCSLLVCASRPLLQKHMTNVEIHNLLDSVLSSIQNPCPINFITILSNCKRLLGKIKVLLVKYQYSLTKW